MHPKGMVVVAVLLCALSRAAAQAPRITLDLHQVTLKQAAAALEKASGQKVRPAAEGNPPKVSATELHDFHWDGVSFGAALREMCAAYRIGCYRHPDQYTLVELSEDSAGEAPAAGKSEFHTSGASVFLAGTDWGKPRNARSTHPKLGLEFLGQFVDRDAESVIGLENVVAKDEHGNLLTSQDGPFQAPVPQPRSPYPDQWRARIELPFSDLQARKLEWVQGDVMAYRTFSTPQLEWPWAEGAPPVRKTLDGYQVDVQCFAPFDGTPRTQRPMVNSGLRVRKQDGSALGSGIRGGVSVEAHVYAPGKSAAKEELVVTDLLVFGASGREYRGSGVIGQGRRGDEISPARSYFDFPPIPEPVANVRLYFDEGSSAGRLFTFRLTDIALPAIPAPAPEAATPVLADPARSPLRGKISLSLERVNAAEAVAVLNRLGRESISLDAPPRQDGLGDEVQRASFHWKDVTLGAALREVCAAYQLICRPVAFAGDELILSVGNPKTQQDRLPDGPPAFESPVLRMYCAGGSWVVPPNGGVPRLVVDIPCALEQVDAGQIAFFDNLVARDDLGNVISCIDSRAASTRHRPEGSPFPDRWLSEIQVPLRDSHDRKLVWLEGEVRVQAEDPSVELPFQTGPAPTRTRVGQEEVEVRCFPARPAQKPGESAQGPFVEIHALNRGENSGDLHAEMVGVSGRVYHSRELRGEMEVLYIGFAPIAEPIAKLRVKQKLRQSGVALVKFRIQNISLPPEPALPLTKPQ